MPCSSWRRGGCARRPAAVRPRGCPAGLPAASPARWSRPAGRGGEERLPVIRLHDLRHPHATLLLADGVPVKVVSERLGHASATITLTVYQHVHPGMGREAADRFAALLEG
ncbi:MAG: tyrosine-type recombinase/integrase [Friedmanniella sp.]